MIAFLLKKNSKSQFALVTLGLLFVQMNHLYGLANYFQQPRNVKEVYGTFEFSNESLIDAFGKIEEATGFSFSYNINDISKMKVSGRYRQQPLYDILVDFSRQLHLKFRQYNDVINVKPKGQNEKGMEVEIAKLAFRIQGTVTDPENKSGLPGVNVLEKGTSNGTVTDQDGQYTLNVSNENVTIIFSYIGYLSEEVEVNGRSTIDIELSPDVKSLQEVLVVGYGTTTKQNLTTAIVKVDPADIPKAANNSISELLFGRAAGLRAVQQSSEPGGQIDLSIRGRGNPLIVVDGIVYPNSGLEPDNGSVELQGVNRGGLAGLNPADIESIEILKDASAAIYGVNAADGVILITTKKGKAGRMKIEYNGSRSVVKSMPYLEPLNATAYMMNFNRFSRDKYLADNNMAPFGPGSPSGFVPKYSEQEIQNAGEGTDWLDQVLRTGSIDNHNISVNGGSENATYFFSGNYFHNQGILENSDLERFTGRLNVSFNLSKILTLNTSINANRNFYSNSGAGWQAGGSGSQGFGALQAALGYPSNVPVYDDAGNYSQFGVIGNPVSLLDIKDNTDYSGLLANISLDIDIIPNVLSGKLLYGNNNENAIRDFYIPSDVFWGQIYLSRGTIFENQRQNQTMEGILTYRKALNEFLSIDAVGGVGQYILDETGHGIEASGMLDAINTTSIAAAPTKTASSYKNKEKKRSYFIRSNFDILDRYVVSLAYRYDGYDKFFPQQKYAGFPSASIAWKISNETFLNNTTFLDLLKIRASIGTTGRTVGSVAYGVYKPDVNGARQVQVTFDDGQTIYPVYLQTALDRPGLKWEKTVNTNIGLDFELFKSRIIGSVDLFKDDITNLLDAAANTPQLSPIPTFPVNGGRTIRQGYEISLNTVNVKSTDFQWSTVFNISHYSYNWDKRFEDADLLPYVGEKDPVNAIYVFETDGILQAGQDVPSWQPAGAQIPGSPIFVDKNGDDVLDEQDVVMFKQDPNLVIGFGSSFNYKNFDLNVFLYGQLGAYYWNNSVLWAETRPLVGEVQSVVSEIKNVWSTDNPNGIWPGVAYNASILGLSAEVDTRLASKDFVRFRNITLGYHFNMDPVKKYFNNLRLYVDVQNPFIFTNYVGADPEVQVEGVRGGGPAPYPMTRTFSLGINVNF